MRQARQANAWDHRLTSHTKSVRRHRWSLRTDRGSNRIGTITPDGTITEHDLPTPGSEPHGITLGPDGALWRALATGARAPPANDLRAHRCSGQ